MRAPFDLSGLRRGSVPRAAATYLVTSWLVLEVGHIISMILELPHVAMKVVFGLLVVGFPVAMILAWQYGRAVPNINLDLPETEPASGAEHRVHEAEALAHGEAGGAGHGGHGGHGAVDPLPFIVGGMILLAVIFLGAGQFIGANLGSREGSEEAPAATRAAQAGRAATGAVNVAAPPNSVGVLPFDNLSGDPKRDYFAEGLSEEVLDALAEIPALKVSARASSFSLKGQRLDASAIGARLGVGHVLDGSVRQDGSMLRISAELVDARTGYRTWSQTYDRRLTDVFKVQKDIAGSVAEALRVQLGGGQTAAPGGTLNPAAYDAYLRGLRLLDNQGGEDQWRGALAAFDQAVKLDPGYAAAQAGRARALVGIANAFTPAAGLAGVHAQALKAAQAAVRLAPDMAEAQATLGFVLWQAKFDMAAAAAPYDRALRLAPGSAEILERYGSFESELGHGDVGVRALQTAIGLDPINPGAYKLLSAGLYDARRYADSLSAARRALSLSPNLTYAHVIAGDDLLAMGDAGGAAAEYAKEPIAWARLSGGALVAARTGKNAEARRLLAQLIAQFGDGAIYQQAEILAQLGDRDRAIAALGRALTVGDEGVTYMGVDPYLDPIRADPRVQAIARRVGLG
jgi:TolB-like protein/tetratricopeptide (TPR) repeat protein